ncbi:MAG: indole-3-glycerol phosphate synthase TrpC [Candidatus Micrarchaeota archaeon]|nr:indole-3-glycerol phosphate synthase TrpC [Candidatus Micrarchaeota archaeon]MDE1833704.1 indole-3-glycerol phosphate synthase TrpC [Candidatus Micrarchaeota archaeon]MDE1859766.1 indole-3-glycerol phosphate synthase TrpC [Candidatus Micrarchaeota archaeon]
MPNLLNEITSNKALEVERAKTKRPLLELIFLCRESSRTVRDFSTAIRSEAGLAIVAEIKMSSPSSRNILTGIGYEEMAKIYQGSGVLSAISAVTDWKYFRGDIGFIKTVKKAAKVPVLRKDFIIDSYQIYESYAAGADAILLIASILDGRKLKQFISIAHNLGMSCLVETHSRADIDAAIDAGAKIIGINSRDLSTFKLDKGLFEALSGYIPKDVIKVAESGIDGKEDAISALRAGADAILVGTSLLTAENPAEKMRELVRIAR